MSTEVTLNLPDALYQQAQQMAEECQRPLTDILVEILEASLVKKTTGESILEMVADFTSDLTEEELNQFPSDAAENHDHYLYKTSQQS